MILPAQNYIETVAQIERQLETNKTSSTLEELERFENKLTLEELKACFSYLNLHDFRVSLQDLFSKRWERIRNSSMCYSSKPDNAVNQLCLELAKSISPPITNEIEIKALKPLTGPYFLLMPSLEVSETGYFENIHNFALQEVVLSDNERTFIPIAQCLNQASISDTGKLRHVVWVDDLYPHLTSTEIARISRHSETASAYYQAVTAYNIRRLAGDDFLPQLIGLTRALRTGGVSNAKHKTETSTIENKASELNAGEEANFGILLFHQYWQGISNEQRSAIITENPELQEILERLFRSNASNYQEVIFCVELLADKLDPIVERQLQKPALKTLKNKMLAQAQAFDSACKSNRPMKINHSKNPPRHILQKIFKLSITEQSKILKHETYQDTLTYTLANVPETLHEFQLTQNWKHLAAKLTFGTNNDSGLIVASKKGILSTVKLLIDAEADLEHTDIYGGTALHWAANNGFEDIARHLLERGAQLEKRGPRKNTALNFAVLQGKKSVVEFFLSQNANINARDNQGMNALDLAISKSPVMTEPILMRLLTLSIEQQSDCLVNVPNGPYPNALLYIADNIPHLFTAAIEHIAEKAPHEIRRILCLTPDGKGYPPLILGAQAGALKAVGKLLSLGLDIESEDAQHSTALHWAAYFNHTPVLNYLIKQGAQIERKGSGGHTALNFAVLRGKALAVEALLKKNANINARGNDGMNAFDLAIANHPKFIEPILIQMLTLPLAAQTECLSNVARGPYTNALIYITLRKPALLNRLFPDLSSPFFKEIEMIQHFKSLVFHYQKMHEKAQKNSRYKNAASTAERLLNACTEAMISFCESNEPVEKKISLFKETCIGAIEKARPVLKQYREWARVLGTFFIALMTLPISAPLYALGFFSIKTKAEQLLDKTKAALDTPPITLNYKP